MTEPEKLLAPKIWAKAAIVSILTANGLAIHRFVIPFIRRQIGFALLSEIMPATKIEPLDVGKVAQRLEAEDGEKMPGRHIGE